MRGAELRHVGQPGRSVGTQKRPAWLKPDLGNPPERTTMLCPSCSSEPGRAQPEPRVPEFSSPLNGQPGALSLARGLVLPHGRGERRCVRREMGSARSAVRQPPITMLTEVVCFLSFLRLPAHLLILCPRWRRPPPTRCASEALRTAGLRPWTSTWACSCPPCSTRRLRNSRNASSSPPGTWRSLAPTPRQRWAMVRCVQSAFRWAGRCQLSTRGEPAAC